MKIDFFISPAYRVPPISTSFLPKLRTMNVPLRVPCAAGIGLEVGRVQHGEAGPELGQLGRHGADEHVPHEQGVPRVRRDEPHRHPVRRVGAAEQVLDEQLAGVEIGPHVLVQPLERRGVEPRVLLPPDPVGAAGLLDHELVLGRPAGVGRGDGGEGAGVGQRPFAAPQRVLDQRGRRQIGVDADREEACSTRVRLSRDCAVVSVHTLPGAFARQRDRPATGAGRLAGKIDRRAPGGNLVRFGPGGLMAWTAGPVSVRPPDRLTA